MGTVERNTLKRPVQSWMTDRAFCFCLVLAILMISAIVISSDYSDGVVLAKVMKAAKEISPDDKKRGAAPAGGRAADCLSGCRRCKEGGPAAGVGGAVCGVQGSGVMVCRGWLGRAMIGRQFGGI